MKLNIKTILLLSFSLLFVLGSVSNASAQFKKNKSSTTGSKFKIKKKGNIHSRTMHKNYISSIKGFAGINSATYFGELCDKGECIKLRPSISLGAYYRYDQHFTFRSSLSWFRLAGSDEGNKFEARNLHFRSDNFELKIDGTYDLFAYNKMYRRRKEFVPYFSAGIALFTYTPKAKLDGKWYNLRKFQTEGVKYGKMSLAIPIGGGVRIKVNPLININLELAYRFTFIDYLDDISHEYSQEIYDLPATDIRRRLANRFAELNPKREGNRVVKRGGNTAYDTYFMFGASIDYTLKVTKQHNGLRKKTSRMRLRKMIKK